MELKATTIYKGTYLVNRKPNQNHVFVAKEDYHCPIMEQKMLTGIRIKNGEVQDDFEMSFKVFEHLLVQGKIVRID